MIAAVFKTIIYFPLYNALIYLVGVVPGHDVGIAIIALTIVVRIIIYPLSRRAVRSQLEMKKVAPEVEALKKKHKNNNAEQSQAIFALYKERGIHPFSSFLLILVQMPILIALYWTFARGGLPKIDLTILYPFVHASPINMEFLGFVNMGAPHNIVLALLAALTQFVYTRLSMGAPGQQSAAEATLSTDMAKSFEVQARYVLPVMFAFIAYIVVAAAPLYYVTSNTFMIAQEYAAGRRFRETTSKSG